MTNDELNEPCVQSKINAVIRDIYQAAEAIRSAEALLITAGAGMGVDSGLPDFRGNEGFWKTYPVVAKLGLSFVEMANPLWFENDPELAWAFYGHRLNLYRQTAPHEGFATLLNWATSKPERYFVFTSNVDGHFQKAGFDADRVEECHGSLHHLQCVNGCSEAIWDARNEKVSINETTFRARQPLPRCPRCGGLARPNVLMFGDYSWLGHRTDAQHRRFQQWLDGLEKSAARLAVIELGAGTAIPTVRDTSEKVVERMYGHRPHATTLGRHTSEKALERRGGSLIRINPREFAVPPSHWGIASGALDGIRQLESAWSGA